MAKDNDRQRLQQIEQTDLTESRLNEDFVFWLKTKGPTWLLVVLVAVTGYLFWVRWQQHKTSKINEAWVELINSDRPESLEEVADTHAGIFAVPLLARSQAADSYLRATLTNRDFSDDPALAVQLTEEQRSDYLNKADRLYESVITTATEAGSDKDTLPHIVYALFGRAAVAEAKGELEAARGFYNDAASRAESRHPALAEQARQRAANVEEAAKLVFLPSVSELPQRTSVESRTPLQLDEALENLIFPENAPLIQEPVPGSGAFTPTPR